MPPVPAGQTGDSQEQDALAAVHARLRAKALALMFGVGTVLLILSLFTLDPADPSRTTTAAAAGAVLTLLLFAGGQRIPGWAVQLLLACGTVLIEWVIYGTGENASTYTRSEEHTSELQSHRDIVCRLLLEKKKKNLYSFLPEKKKKIKGRSRNIHRK